MKFLELRFKNLNSLYGEWVIDFTDPEYAANGIFALTGPTGAGKSTILDAICLALYGSTPRLGKITKSGNEIMSRQTGECYAEAVFESQAGRFRCHWEQRRARKKPDGRLQDQEHQIADAHTGKPIETKKSLVTAVIEKKTGMDFDRFTRSILLAQGGFDSFLKADAEQKSRILEQITGTGIYSEISRRVHDRCKEEKEKLNLLQAETAGIMILEPEQEQQMEQELAEKEQQETELAEKSKGIFRAITWLKAIEDLKRQIDTLAEEAGRLQGRIDDFAPQRTRLEQSLKAAVLDGQYASLNALRQQQADDLETLQTLQGTIPHLQNSACQQVQALKIAEQAALTQKENLQTAGPVLQKIRLLDQKITEQEKNIAEHTAVCTKDAAKIEAASRAKQKEQAKQRAAEKRLEGIVQYLEEHEQDEWLISGLAGIEEQLDSLVSRQQDILQKRKELANADDAMTRASQKLENAASQCAAGKQELEKVGKRLQQARQQEKKLLGEKLLREYRSQKEALLREMAYIKKIEELQYHRTKLEDGSPCPLCGATAHPFAAGNVPVPDEVEQEIASLDRLITRAEDQEALISQLEQTQTAARETLNASDKLEAKAANDKQAAEKIRMGVKTDLAGLEEKLAELSQVLSRKLAPLGCTADPADPGITIRNLQSRMQTWQEQIRQKNEMEKQIASISSEVKRLDAVMETQVQALREKQKNLEQLKKSLDSETENRKQLYGSKNPDEEERLLHKAIADAEETEKQARNLNAGLQEELTTAKTQVESVNKRISQRLPELEKAENGFLAALATAGFADETLFLSARLPRKKQEALAFQEKELDHAQTELKARQKDRQERLAAEKAQKITDKPIEELEPQFKETEEAIKDLRNAKAFLRHRLIENTAAKDRIKEKQQAIEAQKKEFARFEKLHVLIGSADGKKYRNFAQGLTFERMVTHANEQLAKMTDRYFLIRDEHQPLELNVADYYQAGEIRSTRNLSGGESFIVSLTLALGLSQMASQKVRVDSLFLDEGFGTLDDQALETALEALSGLHQNGKLIGIISHVPALKERIRAQINVHAVSNGRSVLSGPGCQKTGTEK